MKYSADNSHLFHVAIFNDTPNLLQKNPSKDTKLQKKLELSHLLFSLSFSLHLATCWWLAWYIVLRNSVWETRKEINANSSAIGVKIHKTKGTK